MLQKEYPNNVMLVIIKTSIKIMKQNFLWANKTIIKVNFIFDIIS